MRHVLSHPEDSFFYFQPGGLTEVANHGKLLACYFDKSPIYYEENLEAKKLTETEKQSVYHALEYRAKPWGE